MSWTWESAGGSTMPSYKLFLLPKAGRSGSRGWLDTCQPHISSCYLKLGWRPVIWNMQIILHIPLPTAHTGNFCLHAEILLELLHTSTTAHLSPKEGVHCKNKQPTPRPTSPNPKTMAVIRWGHKNIPWAPLSHMAEALSRTASKHKSCVYQTVAERLTFQGRECS